MKKVCDKYGALLILDEVMCGMGRCGTLHAWEQEGIVPDLQTIGKGLGGGYAPVSGMLVGHRIAAVLEKGTGAFSHGHTYQGHPVACAVAYEVQSIIKEQNLLKNVRAMGATLERLLHEKLDPHPHVGNIRGKGLFWGVSGNFLNFPRLRNFRIFSHAVRSNLLKTSSRRRPLIQKWG